MILSSIFGKFLERNFSVPVGDPDLNLTGGITAEPVHLVDVVPSMIHQPTNGKLIIVLVVFGLDVRPINKQIINLVHPLDRFVNLANIAGVVHLADQIGVGSHCGSLLSLDGLIIHETGSSVNPFFATF